MLGSDSFCDIVIYRFYSVKQFHINIYRYFKNKIRIALVGSGVIIVLIGIIMLVPHKAIISALLLIGAVIFAIVIHTMLFHYLFLISVHLTEKEFVSRK